MAVNNPDCVSTKLMVGNMTIPRNTCTSYSFSSFANANSTVGSDQVLPYVQGAYRYDLMYYGINDSNLSHQSFVLNITGSQQVTGGWGGGYSIRYTGNKLLNVSFEYAKPSHYVVTHVSVYDIPDRNYSKSYTPQQQQVVAAALQNDTVAGLMEGSSYYVKVVYPHGSFRQNPTNQVQFQQVDGSRAVDVDVYNATAAVAYYQVGNNVDVECFNPDGHCLTDPWGVNPDAGSVMPPLYVTVAYPGQWSLRILGSGNATGVSAPFAYNQTFTGTGNTTITVPWFSNTGAVTLFASAQKVDGGTATLQLTVNWIPPGIPGDPGDPTTTTAGLGVSTATVYDYQVV